MPAIFVVLGIGMFLLFSNLLGTFDGVTPTWNKEPSFKEGECLKEKDKVDEFGDVDPGTYLLYVVKRSNKNYKVSLIMFNKIAPNGFVLNRDYVERKYEAIDCGAALNE